MLDGAIHRKEGAPQAPSPDGKTGQWIADRQQQVGPSFAQGPGLRRGQFRLAGSRDTFSFGRCDDPKQAGFSDLLVINDDRVQPGKRFGTHPHRDMETFSCVLEGALRVNDTAMQAGDGARQRDLGMLRFNGGQDAEALLFNCVRSHCGG